jgi:competence ComEA-like helix-hairpin-helix protein
MSKKKQLNRLKFSRREKRGSLLLLAIVVALFVLPKLFNAHTKPLSVSLTEEEMEAQNQFKKVSYEKKNYKKNYNNYNNNSNKYQNNQKKDKPMPTAPFDPDTMSAASWQNLGLSEKQSEVLISYKNRSGGFYEIDQLYKAYVLDSTNVTAWKPFLVFNKRKPIEKKIELNSATQEELVSLKGIGEKLSERIIKHREKIGGFQNLDQLSEVYGLSPETIANIKPKVVVDIKNIIQLNINEIDIKTLAAHPYVSYNTAKLIVNYREQHGAYEKAEDLLKIYGIEAEELSKLKPYIKFAP